MLTYSHSRKYRGHVYVLVLSLMKGHKLTLFLSTVAAGGSGGALIAAPCSDFLGRKKSMIIFSFLFVVGAAMQEVANLGVFYAGRLFAGIAVGATSMLAPQYLGENSPKSIRGSLTTSYNLMIILALCLAFWINYGVSRRPQEGIENNNAQWRVSLAIQIIPGGIMFLMMLCKFFQLLS